MSIFGFSTESSGGGDFLPIVKYDARAGRLFRRDRVDVGGQYTNEDVDITSTFKAVVDFENVETGWVNFSTGGAPDFRLVPMGTALPQRPSEAHKNGIRFMLKLSKDCGGEKPIREVSSTARAFLSGVEAVFLEYQSQQSENAGKLPVVTLEKTTPIKTGSGDKASTNYQPTFKIVGWAPRGDLVFQPKNPQPASAPAFNASSAPPSTGSTKVEPPKAKQAEPALEDDFG